MKIINLTPHNIDILDVDETPIVTIKPSMKVARLDSVETLLDNFFYQAFAFPMFVSKYDIPYLAKIDERGNELERVQFPEQEGGIIYIVSGLFRANYERSDLWQPGKLIRDEKGLPIGCVGLSQ